MELNKNIKNVLIDLDGTLLPMDFDVFLNGYISAVSTTAESVGLTKELFKKGLWSGIVKMMENDGTISNEQAFWRAFTFVTGAQKDSAEGVLNNFYSTNFNGVKKYCGFTKNASVLVQKLKQKGYNLILATNPVFPKIATLSRLNWAGVDSKNFTFISTYENSSYCKPNVKYYLEILQKLNLNASECLMIGNDVLDDMVAKSANIETFLLTDCLINKNNEDINNYNNGNFEDLFKFLKI